MKSTLALIFSILASPALAEHPALGPLCSPDKAIRLEAASAIRKQGIRSIPLLQEGLRSPPCETARGWCIRLAGEMGPSASPLLDDLRRLLQTGSEKIREEAVEAMQKIDIRPVPVPPNPRGSDRGEPIRDGGLRRGTSNNSFIPEPFYGHYLGQAEQGFRDACRERGFSPEWQADEHHGTKNYVIPGCFSRSPDVDQTGVTVLADQVVSLVFSMKNPTRKHYDALVRKIQTRTSAGQPLPVGGPSAKHMMAGSRDGKQFIVIVERHVTSELSSTLILSCMTEDYLEHLQEP